MGEGLRRATNAARATRGEPPLPEHGQIWADNDPRSAGRTLRVDSIEGDEAICTILTNTSVTQAEIDRGMRSTQDRRGKTTRISLARFRPTSSGYRLLGEGDPR